MCSFSFHCLASLSPALPSDTPALCFLPPTPTPQDTPGYGDDLDINNHINMIVGYLNSRNEKWLAMESATDRAQDLSEVEDPRVDVCLFCVPPHRLRAIDIK